MLCVRLAGSWLTYNLIYCCVERDFFSLILFYVKIKCKILTIKPKFITYRKKKKCLFKRKGKVLGYDVICENPNTQIVDIEYIEILK